MPPLHDTPIQLRWPYYDTMRKRTARTGQPWPGDDSDNTHIFMNPATGEEVNLRNWAKCDAQTFELRTALQQRRPGLFHHGLTDGGKHHLRCVNDGEHTQGGTDTATFVANASESTSSGFAYHCRHAHCDGRDRLLFLRRMLEEGWLSLPDLVDPAFHVDGTPPRPLIRKVKSFDPKVVTGSKPSGVLLDELHVIAEAHDADRVIGQLRGGLLPNPEGFLLTITTQSERPPSGVFRTELLKARKVRDGTASLPILPMLYEFPDGTDWKDPANWWMVLPNNGLSVSVDRLLPDYEAAVESGDAELARWASQHLNVQIRLALKSDLWSGADHWLGATDAKLTLEGLLERSDVVTIGIDGGGLDDLLSVAILGRETAERRWLSWSKSWVHASVLDRRKSEAARLQDFEDDGDLVIVEDMEDAFTQVAALCAEVEQSGLLAQVGLDPMGVGAIVDALAEGGIAGNDRVVGVPQGWTLNGAMVAPSSRRSRASTACCLVPSRGPRGAMVARPALSARAMRRAAMGASRAAIMSISRLVSSVQAASTASAAWRRVTRAGAVGAASRASAPAAASRATASSSAVSGNVGASVGASASPIAARPAGVARSIRTAPSSSVLQA